MKKFGLLCFFLLLSSCSKPEVFEHIEVSSIETMTESTGSVIKFIPSGYVNSNSITYTKDWRDKTKMEVSAIEDHYDVDGNYIKTVVFSSSDEYKKFHNQVGGEREERELNEPATILLPSEFKQTTILELTEEEKKQVKQHVEDFVKPLE